MDKPLRVVAGFVCSPLGRYLVVQRPLTDKHLAGKWEFPGGKIEPNEDFAQALKRELLEELSLTVTVKTILDPIVYQYPTRTIQLWAVLAHCLSEQVILHEHIDAKWLSLQQSLLLDLAPADRPLVDQVLLSVT